jgi:acetate kinase
MNNSTGPILVVNSGSSSLKFGVFTNNYGDESLQFTGSIDSIGSRGGKLKLKDGNGKSLLEENSGTNTQEEAFHSAMEALEKAGSSTPIALGHRIVHGGPKLRQHQRITPEVLNTLRDAVHFAPLHDPPAIAIIEAAQKHFTQQGYGDIPQFACFDTAFHTTLPEVAAHYPLPKKYWDEGVLRYGFHGLSYESIVHTLGHTQGDKLPKRMIVAHLGNGASLAAILDGKSIDTSMGLTPTGGIPMGTRAGDLDPSIVLWLLRSGLSVYDVESLLNHSSGLAGLSNGESDMRALTKAADAGDAPSILAIDIFTRSIAKTIAAYIVSLEGLDALVFTGGIGENSAPVRAKVCHHLHPFAIQLDKDKNTQSAGAISTATSTSEIRVIVTDEDGQIARHTRELLLIPS